MLARCPLGRLLLTAAAGLLVACGGGRDGGAGVPATTLPSTSRPSTAVPATPAAPPAPTVASTTPPPPPSSVPTRPDPPPTSGAPATTAPRPVHVFTTRGPAGTTQLEVSEIARGLDTVWSLAFGPDGRVWFTERPGRLTRLGDAPRLVAGVVEAGEGGLLGVEVDPTGGVFVMYTSESDNRVVRLGPNGTQTVLVGGIAKAGVHNGGRLRFGPDGTLYAATGDAANPPLAARDDSLNGKVLAIDAGRGGGRPFSKGHRNVQGLCFSGSGRFFATEHGPDRGDEINELRPGFDGGWPATTGTGLRNYTPTIAPAGCAVYRSDLIPAWRDSLLFVTLKDRDLRRLTFAPDGSVAGEEVLLDGVFGRLRDVAVGPDGAVYIATSNRDGRGDPKDVDDRILRIAPPTR